MKDYKCALLNPWLKIWDYMEKEPELSTLSALILPTETEFYPN